MLCVNKIRKIVFRLTGTRGQRTIFTNVGYVMPFHVYGVLSRYRLGNFGFTAPNTALFPLGNYVIKSIGFVIKLQILKAPMM